MTLGHGFHHGHQHQIVVYGQVRLLVYRGYLELVGGHLVVPCLDRYAELVTFRFQLPEEGEHPLRYGSEVMILQLLALCALMAHQGPSRQQKIGAVGIEGRVYQEELLLPTQIRYHPGTFHVEVFQEIGGRLAHRPAGSQKRRLVIQSLPCV